MGLSNYPEKGTVNDPEIDDSGKLSLWARAGYPKVQKDIKSKKGRGETFGTLFAPGPSPEKGEIMTDRHISADLEISPQSIGTRWRKLSKALSQMAGELIEHLEWTGTIDEFEGRFLREAHTRLAVALLQDVVPNVLPLYEELARISRIVA